MISMATCVGLFVWTAIELVGHLSSKFSLIKLI